MLAVWLILLIVCVCLLIKWGKSALALATPYRYLQAIGQGVLDALQCRRLVNSSGVAVATDHEKSGSCYVYLKSGTEREKDVFAQCISEMFGEVDNQRYLLMARENVPRLCRYYCVPECFGTKKEDAQFFAEKVQKYLGNYDLVYTRNGQGRRVLLEARVHSFANTSARCADKKKKVKDQFS